MKLPTLLLAGSLVANAALVAAFFVQPTLAPPSIRDFFSSGSRAGRAEAEAAAARRASAASAAQTAAARAHAWATLQSDDLKTLVARLRAAGFPPSVVRAIVMGQINARYAARYKELMTPTDNAAYWKAPVNIFGPNDSKRMEEFRQLGAERAKLQRELLGDDFFNENGELTAAQRREFGDLSRSKIDLIQRINDDYAQMTSDVRAGMMGVTLPEDREKLALLDREKHADLAAVLTPDELADYEMRSSPITSMLRTRLGLFDPSENEFRALYQAQKTLSDTLSPGGATSGDMDIRRTAQQQFADQVKAALGPDRYAEYTRDTSSDFQQLARLTERENLPAAVAVQAYNLRDNVATESNRIFNDGSLSLDDKKAALQALAQNTRTQLLASLGPTAGAAYIKIADPWLSNVERGSAVTFNGNFSGTMTMNGVTMVSGNTMPSYRRLPGTSPAGPTGGVNSTVIIRQ